MSHANHDLFHSLLKRLNHLLCNLGCNAACDRRVHWVRELELNRQIDLCLILTSHRICLCGVLVRVILVYRARWRGFVVIWLQRPSGQQVRHNRVFSARVLIWRWPGAVMRDFLARETALHVSRYGLDYSSWHAVDARRKLFADVLVEADDELGFFGVFFAILSGLRVFRDGAVAAVGQELAV